MRLLSGSGAQRGRSPRVLRRSSRRVPIGCMTPYVNGLRPKALMSSNAPALTEIALRPRYSSGRNDLTREFFAPCIEAGQAYDRAVGFFSSSFYTLVNVPMAAFALRGGKLR